MSSDRYSAVPPVIRVKDASGAAVVLNLAHVVAVDTTFRTDQPTPARSNVRLSTGQTIALAMTVDEFWDML
jgi:hypothetical protein